MRREGSPTCNILKLPLCVDENGRLVRFNTASQTPVSAFTFGIACNRARLLQAYDISLLKFPSSYHSSLPVLVLGSDREIPNEPKASAGLIVSGCKGGDGGGGEDYIEGTTSLSSARKPGCAWLGWRFARRRGIKQRAIAQRHTSGSFLHLCF